MDIHSPRSKLLRGEEKQGIEWWEPEVVGAGRMV